MADPAQPDVAGAEHAGDGSQRALGQVDERGVHRVHQPPADLAGGLVEHGQDRPGDGQADHRVGPAPAEGNPARPEQHRQRGEPVGARVQPVGDQRGRADPAADADAVAGHQLVAREPGQRGRGHRDQGGDRRRVQQAVHRLVGSQRRRGQDEQHDDDPGQVLGPPVPVGVAPARRAPPDQERDTERHRRQRVGRVVQRVAEQRHRPGQHRDHALDRRRPGQHGQRDPHRPHPRRAALGRRVHPVGRLVRVRPHQVHQLGQQRDPVPVFVLVLVAVAVLAVAVRVRVARRCPNAHNT